MLDTVLRWLGCDVQHVSPDTFARAEMDMRREEFEARQREYIFALTERDKFKPHDHRRKLYDDAVRVANKELLVAETNLILAKNSLAKAMEK